jgi:hypothetical protein
MVCVRADSKGVREFDFSDVWHLKGLSRGIRCGEIPRLPLVARDRHPSSDVCFAGEWEVSGGRSGRSLNFTTHDNIRVIDCQVLTE